MINFKPFNSILLCIFLGSSFGSNAYAQQGIPFQGGQIIQQGQPIQQGPIIQGQPIQGQIIQGPIIQGQPIQGQPIQGQIIQGQQGQIIQGQPIQGQIIQSQPLNQGPTIQGQPAPRQSDADKKAMEDLRAKMAAQTISIKKLTDENSRLSNMEELTKKMRTEYFRLKDSYDEIDAELVELKKRKTMPAAESGNSDSRAAFQKLNAQYQQAVEQNQSMSGQIEELTQENVSIKSRLNDLSAAGGNMSNLEASLNTAKNQISQIGQKNQTLTTENNRLQGELETVTTENQQLNARFTTLTQESERLRSEFEMASEKNTTLGDRVNALTTENENYLASMNASPSPTPSTPVKSNAVASRPVVDTGLVEEHERTLALNAELESRNGLLLEQISELEGQVQVGAVDQKAAATGSLLPASPLALVTDSAPAKKFNIINWLIPFLLIGLTIGLYVFLTEENEGGIASSIASTPTRDTQRGQ